MQEDNFDDLDFDKEHNEESFHIEVDFYDTGDLSSMLVIPCNDAYIVVSNNEHLCTLVRTCKEIECWEQQEGTLDEELVEKVGAAIQGARPEDFYNEQ
ncbi:hypothetical protein [Mucilaginibacter lacusdianchii]|uniref:hypothetical protein n=1 Tax=Mucilaginibacter lacusdianchii TaxID=2684211 RepID=UPI00131BED58|nr:hypothetical protein [Mucilaginibacter sp. JXJ CY 39]